MVVVYRVVVRGEVTCVACVSMTTELALQEFTVALSGVCVHSETCGEGGGVISRSLDGVA